VLAYRTGDSGHKRVSRQSASHRCLTPCAACCARVSFRHWADVRLLGAQAERAQAYAKCLKYKEREFHSDPSPDCIEALISVYNQLGLREAAMGILRYSEDRHADHQVANSGVGTWCHHHWHHHLASSLSSSS
jgi:hypothetical protein